MTDGRSAPDEAGRLAGLRRRIAAHGGAPPHARHLIGLWLRGQPLATPYRGDPTFLPRRLREALPQLDAELEAIASVLSRHPGDDGAERMLLGLADGRTIETVLLPDRGVCVSTQVGCAVGCTFCATGRDGLTRQLGCEEIVAQVAAARGLRPVRRVLFMGMGEPAHNLEAVLEAITVLATDGGLGREQLVFSTVGDRRAFARLSVHPVKPSIALSLHTVDAALRARLLPRAPRIDPEELIALADACAQAGGFPLRVQWTLLSGINDRPEDADALARRVGGRRAIVNLIPWNAIGDAPFTRPPLERALAFVRRLRAAGVVATLRWSAAQQVDGGCGQLRARTVPIQRAPRPTPAA